MKFYYYNIDTQEITKCKKIYDAWDTYHKGILNTVTSCVYPSIHLTINEMIDNMINHHGFDALPTMCFTKIVDAYNKNPSYYKDCTRIIQCAYLNLI